MIAEVQSGSECVIGNGVDNEKMICDEKKNHIDRDKRNVVFCHLCNSVVPPAHDIEEHLHGFRHCKLQTTLDSMMKNSPKTKYGPQNYETFVRLHDNVEYENIEKKDNTFICKLCNKQLESVIHTERHLIGKTHARNLSLKSTQCFPWDKIKELEGGKTDNIQKLSSNRFRCKLCCKMLDLMSILSHVGGNGHQIALGLKETKIKDKLHPLMSHQIWNEIITAEVGKWSNISQISSETFRCFPCSQLLSVDDIVHHVKSDNHKTLINSRENVKRNKMLQKNFFEIWRNVNAPECTHEIHFMMANDGTLYCIPCSASLPGTVANLVDHICGKSHMAIVMKYLMSSPGLSVLVLEETVASNPQEALVKALLPREERFLAKEFHCMVCDVRVEQDTDWQQHLGGRRHKRAVDKLCEAAAQLITQHCTVCDATVFCVRSDVDKHDCQMKLSRCNKNIPSGSESLYRINTRSDCTPKIAVSGYPGDMTMSTLYCCFEKFGTVTYIAMTRESAVIQFIDRKGVESVLARPPRIGEIQLKVDKLKYCNHKAEISTEAVHSDIVGVWESAQSFESKLQELCKLTHVVSTPQSSHDTCRFLESELSSLFPGCQAFPFGSRVSGLAFPESDMDIFLDTGDMYDGKHRQEPEVQELIVSVTANALKDLPQCSNVEAVPKARTPIVRFFHISSATKCDVAFRHGLGVENTKLIRFYMSLDERIKPLIVFVKHWAQAHELIGPTKITNYALTWLVIFYLQQASDFGLPSVESLKRLHEGCAHEIAGWKCSFCTDRTAVRTIKPTKSVLQLLHGFLVHYHKFDYSRYVVCPLVGVPIKKNLFVNDNIHNLPESMATYVYMVSNDKHADRFRTTFLCVQDPFDLSHNITKGTPQTLLKKYKAICALSAELCSKINNCSGDFVKKKSYSNCN